MEDIFKCKQFEVQQSKSTMKVNTDGILLGAWVKLGNAKMILDIGAGTGIISLILAQRTKDYVHIDAVEIEEAAALEARQNFINSTWAKRLACVHQSIQDFSGEKREEYDLIVTNPPFFTGGTFSSNENKNNVRHSIKLSHGDLLLAANRLLKSDGRIALILPFLEGERMIDRAARLGFYATRITEVYSKPKLPIERLLIEFSKKRKPGAVVSRDRFVLLEDKPERTYSSAFKDLTKDIYTIF